MIEHGAQLAEEPKLGLRVHRELRRELRKSAAATDRHQQDVLHEILCRHYDRADLLTRSQASDSSQSPQSTLYR